VRALFVLATVLAGVGVLAYVACWLVLPLDSDDGDSPSLVRGMATLALLTAAAAGLTTVALAAATTTLFGFGWAIAVAGAVFLAAALVASSVVRPAWALVTLVAAIVPAVAVAASGVRISPQAGLVTHEPATVADIPAAGYHTGLGDLLVDLRRFKAPARAVVALRIDTGTGATVVALPRDRCFNLDIHYRTGEGWPLEKLMKPLSQSLSRREQKRAAIFYSTSQPLNGHWTRTSDDPQAATLEIDYTAVVGTLTVRDYPANVGPLYDRSWPNTLSRPASPDMLRWEWRDPTRTRSSRRRWRRWRQQLMRFEKRLTELQAGACPRRGSAQ
jgi:hypothetical protein